VGTAALGRPVERSSTAPPRTQHRINGTTHLPAKLVLSSESFAPRI